VEEQETMPLSSLALRLSSALGLKKASQLVRDAASAHRISKEVVTIDQITAILSTISEQPGIVGVSARFVRSRLILELAQRQIQRPRRAAPETKL
jgi:hypothetical protein